MRGQCSKVHISISYCNMHTIKPSVTNCCRPCLSPTYLPRLTPEARQSLLSPTSIPVRRTRCCLANLHFDLASRLPDHPPVPDCLPSTSRYLHPADYPPGSGPATTTTTSSASLLLVPLPPYEGLCVFSPPPRHTQTSPTPNVTCVPDS